MAPEPISVAWSLAAIVVGLGLLVGPDRIERWLRRWL